MGALKLEVGMIKIDLENGFNGELGGDLEIIMSEYKTITMYVYKLFMESSLKNDKPFDELIEMAKVESEILGGQNFIKKEVAPESEYLKEIEEIVYKKN